PPPSPGAAPTVPPAPSRPPPAPGSPAPASGPPCSPPAPAAGSCMAAWPNSPSRPRPSHQKSAPPPAPTRPPSTTCSPEPGWPPEPDQTQDQELDSIFTASPTQAGLDRLRRSDRAGKRLPARRCDAHPPPPRLRTTTDPRARDTSSEGDRDDPTGTPLDHGGWDHRRDRADGRPGHRRPDRRQPDAHQCFPGRNLHPPLYRTGLIGCPPFNACATFVRFVLRQLFHGFQGHALRVRRAAWPGKTLDGPDVEEEGNSHPAVLGRITTGQLVAGPPLANGVDQHPRGFQRAAIGLQRTVLAVKGHLDAAAIDHRCHRRGFKVRAGDHERRGRLPALERP